MTTTDDARLLEIEARERVATLGPWEVDPRTSTRVVAANDRGVATAGGYTTNTDDGAHHWQNDANACFIAHSREDVRFLLDRLKAAESRIRELERIVDDAIGLVDAVSETRKRSGDVVLSVSMASWSRHLRERLASLQSDEIQEE